MRRTKAEIEANIPPPQDRVGGNGVESNSLPQIRRQVERICESIGVDYDDVAQMVIEPGFVTVVTYERNEAGEFFMNEFNKPAQLSQRILVDTATFKGDERDF